MNMKAKRTRLWNGCIVSLMALCLCCLLSSCDIQGNTLTSDTDVTVNTTSTGSTTTASPGAKYFEDTFNESCTGCELHNAAYLVGGGVLITAPSDAYIKYALPLRDVLSVQVKFSGAGATNGDKRVLLHLTDSMDAWVGDNHVWTDSNLIGVRHVDGKLRFRVGGSGQGEFPTEYVYEGLDAGTHLLTVSVTTSTAVLILDGATLATFDATTFRPSQLFLLVGGGVLNESSLDVVIHAVGVYY